VRKHAKGKAWAVNLAGAGRTADVSTDNVDDSIVITTVMGGWIAVPKIRADVASEEVADHVAFVTPVP
jgi:hypothetical protein